MAPKADAAFGLTAILAAINTWFNTNMSLVTGSCMIVSTAAAVWYYRRQMHEKVRDRALAHQVHELNREKHELQRRLADANRNADYKPDH